MDITWFDINNTLWMIHSSGYELSWIAIGTIAGLLCIWLASQEKPLIIYLV